MPSWILPGRSNARITRYKAILEKSFAFSQTCNPRNLEYHWYPTWNQVLSDLVIDVPNLIVAPQYPIWFVPQNDEENGDASDPEETEDDEDISDPEQIQDDGDNGGADDPEEMVVSDDEDHVMADVSFASTLPEKGAKSAIVDFAIIHLTAVPQPKHTTRYNGWRITQANVGLLVEVKKFASRSLTGAELEHAVQGRIAGARDDLINQAAHLFVQDECKDSVMAIAAAGPWWCSAKICREDVKKTMLSITESDPTYHAPSGDVELNWSSIVCLDLALSNDSLHTIYESLKESGVLQTPRDV